MEDPEAPPVDASGLPEELVQPTDSQDLGGENSYASPVGKLAEPYEEQGEPAEAIGTAPDHLPAVSPTSAAPPPPKAKPPASAKEAQSKLPKVKAQAPASSRAYSAPKSRPDMSKNWNPHLAKPVDTSLALKKPGPSSLGSAHESSSIRPSGNVSSPTRAERAKRKGWAEAAAKRQAEAARRLMESEAKLKAEAEARMEARKAAVRARIEQEKEAQARLAAKRAALLKPPAGGEQPPAAAEATANDPRHAMRKRANSPRPLYIRLQEDYDRKQMQEEEETRKKLDMLAAQRQVRVQALMNGEVVIRPLPDEVKPPKEDVNATRWNPAYRVVASPQRDRQGGSFSPHRSRGTSLNGDHPGDTGSEASPARRIHNMTKENNGGVVLYSMQDDENAGDSTNQSPLLAGGNRRGKLVTRRDRDAAAGKNQRFNNRRMPMVDRACSPFKLDPASQQPVNAPPQDQFWPQQNKPAAAQPAPAQSAGKRMGALEQAPPPPPTSRFDSKPPAAAKQQHAAEEVAVPNDDQLQEETSQVAMSPDGNMDLGESFAEEAPDAEAEAPLQHEDAPAEALEEAEPAAEDAEPAAEEAAEEAAPDAAEEEGDAPPAE